jgi:phosphatidylglycerophosphate synthase
MKSVHSNRFKDVKLAARSPFIFSPFGTFAMAAIIGGALLLVGSFMLIGPKPGMQYATIIGLTAYFMTTIWAGRRLITDFPHSRLGLCNLATLGRLVIVGILFVALLEGLHPTWSTFGLAILALSLDGVDGWLARKEGLASKFGARFDVEVDAAFALVLAISAAVNDVVGSYVVLLGLPYYLFGAAKAFLPWLNQPLPDRFSRKAVCVFQIAALIALQAPFFTDGRLDLVVAAVTVALIWSFGRDIIWLWRKFK